MSSILPKGIVVNTPEISGDIQKIDREPLALEEIAKFWKVYTTTKRRLVDPTAERLENFWWRIWGSPRRNLRGATIARIFADISDEISFVPLRGPPNRDESGGRMVAALGGGLGTTSTTSTTAIHGRQGSDSSYDRESSSLSKYATTMPPPILKKSRGPSGTGPRPTARFISPKTSEEEDADEASSSTSLNAKVVVRPPTPPTPLLKERKKAEASAGSKKKGQGSITATTLHRRRPGVSRRPNSDPATRIKETLLNSNKVICKSLQEKSKLNNGSENSPSQPDLNEHVPPSSETLLSSKGPRKTQPEKSDHSRRFHHQGAMQEQDLNHTSITNPALSIVRGEGIDWFEPIREEGDYSQKADYTNQVSELKTQERLTFTWQVKPQLAVSSRSSSPTDLMGSKLHNDERAQPHLTGHHPLNNIDGKTSTSAPRAYTAATMEVVDQDEHDLEPKVIRGASTLVGEEEWSGGRLEQAPLFAKRPIQPAKSASALFSSPTYQSNGSMSRSKSQLTLLLERDRQK